MVSEFAGGGSTQKVEKIMPLEKNIPTTYNIQTGET